MSTVLDNILAQVPQLSLTEILTLQENLIGQVRTRTSSNGNGHNNGSSNGKRAINLQGAYRFSAAEIETHLAKVFSPAQLNAAKQTDTTKLSFPTGTPTAAQLISEDREDRF